MHFRRAEAEAGAQSARRATSRAHRRGGAAVRRPRRHRCGARGGAARVGRSSSDEAFARALDCLGQTLALLATAMDDTVAARRLDSSRQPVLTTLHVREDWPNVHLRAAAALLSRLAERRAGDAGHRRQYRWTRVVRRGEDGRASDSDRASVRVVRVASAVARVAHASLASDAARAAHGSRRRGRGVALVRPRHHARILGDDHDAHRASAVRRRDAAQNAAARWRQCARWGHRRRVGRRRAHEARDRRRHGAIHGRRPSPCFR